MKIKNQKGFSLVELLVVMFIIAVLTGVLLPNLMGARQKAKDAQKISDAGAIKDALRLYYNESQSYPLNREALMTVLPTYMPGVIGTGITYTPGVNNDSFVITFGLESASGDEDTESQLKCGISTPVQGVYAVCAK